MSLCRVSKDSDIYTYQTVMDGENVFATHVAAQRSTIDMTMETIKMSWEEINKSFKPIGLRHDGEMFISETLEELHSLMRYLAREGYKVPPHMFSVRR